MNVGSRTGSETYGCFKTSAVSIKSLEAPFSVLQQRSLPRNSTTIFPPTSTQRPYGDLLDSNNMQLSTFLIPLSLLSTALAAPLTEAALNETAIAQRALPKFSYIEFYDANNEKCEGSALKAGKDPRQELHYDGDKGECLPFSRPPGTRIKIFWGTGMYKRTEVSTFTKPGCNDTDYAHKFSKGTLDTDCLLITTWDNDSPYNSVRVKHEWPTKL